MGKVIKCNKCTVVFSSYQLTHFTFSPLKLAAPFYRLLFRFSQNANMTKFFIFANSFLTLTHKPVHSTYGFIFLLGHRSKKKL